jgi:hypothetical protein
MYICIGILSMHSMKTPKVGCILSDSQHDNSYHWLYCRYTPYDYLYCLIDCILTTYGMTNLMIACNLAAHDMVTPIIGYNLATHIIITPINMTEKSFPFKTDYLHITYVGKY